MVLSVEKKGPAGGWEIRVIKLTGPWGDGFAQPGLFFGVFAAVVETNDSPPEMLDIESNAVVRGVG